MKATTSLLLTSLLAASMTDAASAGGGTDPYNRRAAAMTVQDNGDGTKTLSAFVQFQVFEQPAAPLDLATRVQFIVNGVDVAYSLLLQTAADGHTCPDADYQPCGDTALGEAGCARIDPDMPAGVCTSSAIATAIVPDAMVQPGDTFYMRLLVPPGAAPELDFSDDISPLQTATAADHTLGRTLKSATATPSPIAPAGDGAGSDSFFDIAFEIDLDSDPTYPVDLTSTVEVHVNGIVLQDVMITSFQTGGSAGADSFPSVPCGPGDEVLVVLSPAPGALPELPGFEDPAAVVEIPTLTADVDAMSVSAGGTQTFSIQAGAAHAGELYLILGTTSGTAPGTPAGAYNLPLNVDWYFLYTLNHPNSVVLKNTFGALDALGGGKASFVLPFASNPALAGTTLHHAGVLLDPVTLQPTGTTNAVGLQLL